MGKQVKSFEEIEQGAVIASFGIEGGSQHVELHAMELVCFSVINGVKSETKRTPVSEAMKDAVVRQYNARQAKMVSIG